MNKRQLIDDIRQHNHTAQPEFLAKFDEAALQQYLEHLESKSRKRVSFGAVVGKQMVSRTGQPLKLVS